MESEKTNPTTDKVDLDTAWNDRFPPLNLWNYPAKWISEVFYNKDKDVWH
jgi:hypothetical protein